MLQEDGDKTSLLSPLTAWALPAHYLTPTTLEGTSRLLHARDEAGLRGLSAPTRGQSEERMGKAESKTQSPQSPPAGWGTLKPARCGGSRPRTKEKRCFR